MTTKIVASFLFVLAVGNFSPTIQAQDLEGNDLRREAQERDSKVRLLSTEDQLKLRAAQQAAAETPEVKAALEKRNRAVQEYRSAMRSSMIKADPSVEAILDKIAFVQNPRP